MAKILSFLKIFKKKNEINPKAVPKSSLRTTKPKETINSGLRPKQNSGFQSKSHQKLNEKVSDLKTFKSQTTRKQTIEEKERRIELVGNYLKNEDKQREDTLPVRPLRRQFKNSMKPIVDTLKEKKSKDLRKTSQLIVSENQINKSLDSIIEMNGNRVLKTDEKLQKTVNQMKINLRKSEDQTKGPTNELNSTDLVTSKSNLDFVDSEFNGLNVSQSSLHFTASDKSENQSKVVSGLVSIRDIDLKTAKCVVCLRLVAKKINLTLCSHIFCGECLQQWLRYSQHCPQCRTRISSFGHSIRTQFNRICIRSEKDYKVMRVTKNDDYFVDSLGAAYLFDAFLLNREVSKYLDSITANICSKISDLETKLSTNGSVQRNVNIRYRITEENHRLEEFKKKKRQSEESFEEICNETNPQMLSFWKQVFALRVNSNLSPN